MFFVNKKYTPLSIKSTTELWALKTPKNCLKFLKVENGMEMNARRLTTKVLNVVLMTMTITPPVLISQNKRLVTNKNMMLTPI